MGRGEENSLVDVVLRQACEGARKEGVDAVLVSVYLRRPIGATRDLLTHAPWGHIGLSQVSLPLAILQAVQADLCQSSGCC